MSEGRKRMKGLTKRQLQVATLVANGYSNKQIALELGIHPVSARMNITKIMRKLGVTNRTGVAVWVFQNNRNLIK